MLAMQIVNQRLTECDAEYLALYMAADGSLNRDKPLQEVCQAQ